VDESRPISFLVNPLEVDDELVEIVLSIGKYLGTKERDDVIRYYRRRFILKVGVIDTELRIEPVDFVCNQLARNETLWMWRQY
jgi:hypothetical protein